jgi:hypothetical protein
MTPNYMVYQAEGTRTAAEQREADRCAGEMAASLAALLHALGKPFSALRPALLWPRRASRARCPLPGQLDERLQAGRVGH